MSFSALLVAATIPLGSAQASDPVEFPLAGGSGGEVADGALFYQGQERRRGTIRRLDLETGADTVLYTGPDPRTHLSELQAGGERVAFELVSDRTRLLVMRTDGTGLEEIVRSRDRERRDCGSSARLLDVSPSGEVLYEHAVVPCRSGRGTYRVRRTGARPRTLVRRATDTVFLSMGPPFRTLTGEQFTTWGHRLVRVLDLATGRVRRFRPPDLLTDFAEPDVAADGRVLLQQFRFMGKGRFPRQTIRLIGPSGQGRVVHRTRRVFGQARFCGERPVLHTFTQRRARLRLTVLDPPMEVFDGVRDPDVATSCDARHLVQVTISGRAGERAYVHALPE